MFIEYRPDQKPPLKYILVREFDNIPDLPCVETPQTLQSSTE